MRSNTNTLASTAMPIVRMMPAMPGSVRVLSNAAIAPMTRITFKHNAPTAITPQSR